MPYHTTSSHITFSESCVARTDNKTNHAGDDGRACRILWIVVTNKTECWRRRKTEETKNRAPTIAVHLAEISWLTLLPLLKTTTLFPSSLPPSRAVHVYKRWRRHDDATPVNRCGTSSEQCDTFDRSYGGRRFRRFMKKAWCLSSRQHTHVYEVHNNTCLFPPSRLLLPEDSWTQILAWITPFRVPGIPFEKQRPAVRPPKKFPAILWHCMRQKHKEATREIILGKDRFMVNLSPLLVQRYAWQAPVI